MREAVDRATGTFLDADARRVLDRALVLLWQTAPHAVAGARSASMVAGGLIWVVGKANGLFDGGFTQQAVRRELWLKQGLNVAAAASELAQRRRISLTEAVHQAVEEALASDRRSRADFFEQVKEIQHRAALSDEPYLSDDDLYDERGLPR